LSELYFYVLYQLYNTVISVIYVGDNVDIFIAHRSGKGAKNKYNNETIENK